MKRVFGMITLAALLAMGSVSCKKNTETNASFTFALPTADGFSLDEGKAYIDVADGSKMKWYDGDQVMIYSVDATNTTPVTGVFTIDAGSTGFTYAHFNGPQMPMGSYGRFIFYPASKAVSVAADNYATFEVGNTQTYSHELDIMSGRIMMDPRGVVAASTCTELNGNLTYTLNHIFGFANVRVKATTTAGAKKKVKSVKITDNTLHLTGDMTIQIPAINDTRLSTLQTLGANYASSTSTMSVDTYMATLTGVLQEMGYSSHPNGNNVTLNCEDYVGGSVPITDSNKCFIISLRPGALLNGFTVTLTYADDTFENFDFNNRKYIIRPGTFSNIQITL